MSYQDNVKPWFQTDDFPTEEQFYLMFAWLRWKDEPIGLEDISPEFTSLINSLLGNNIFSYNGTAGFYTVPAGFAIYMAYVKLSDGISTWQAGDEEDAEKYQAPEEVNAETTTPFTFSVVADTDTLVKFYSEAVDDAVTTTVKIYLHKI